LSFYIQQNITTTNRNLYHTLFHNIAVCFLKVASASHARAFAMLLIFIAGNYEVRR